MTEEESVETLLDRLVAEYSDRLARGSPPERERLLAEAPAEHRPALERCFRVIDAGHLESAARASAIGPGSVLAGYRIVGILGRGGMATVYEAIEERLGRKVALKVLRPGLALEPRHVERFHREARAIARLPHPAILPVHASGEADGHHFIAMDVVLGPTLARVIEALAEAGRRRRTPDDLARAIGLERIPGDPRSFESALVSLLLPAVRAVAAAHEAGLVHRDLKPSNVLFHRDGRAVVADFGLAKGDDDPALSLTGEPIGTPYYMSPEQVERAEAASVGARSDVYSLGVTLYEVLSGQRPFEGKTALAVFEAIRSAEPPRLREIAPDVSSDAEAVVRRAMRKRPQDRYASARELALDLEAVAEGRTTRARALEGGPLRRGATTLARILRGEPFEYRSRALFLGLPLVHVKTGRRTRGAGAPRRAVGWLAIGDVAAGVVAIGRIAFGGVALGAVLGLGPLAVGGAAAAGGLAMGGGLGAGGFAVGGVSAGYAAIGGFAVGRYALGGGAVAKYAVAGDRFDEEARVFFAERFRWPVDLLIPRFSKVLDRR